MKYEIGGNNFTELQQIPLYAIGFHFFYIIFNVDDEHEFTLNYKVTLLNRKSQHKLLLNSYIYFDTYGVSQGMIFKY
jgi:hypothetical protein